MLVSRLFCKCFFFFFVKKVENEILELKTLNPNFSATLCYIVSRKIGRMSSRLPHKKIK